MVVQVKMVEILIVIILVAVFIWHMQKVEVVVLEEY